MTEIDLQREIKRILEAEIFPKLTLFEPGEMKIHLQDIPISTEFDDEDDKYFPCCIVKLCGGEIGTASDPQLTKIEIIVCVKDWSEDMTGYQSLVVTIQRIRDYFTSHSGIRGKFRIKYPIKWAVDEDVSAPYFIGNITTAWHTEIMPYADIEKFL